MSRARSKRVRAFLALSRAAWDLMEARRLAGHSAGARVVSLSVARDKARALYLAACREEDESGQP